MEGFPGSDISSWVLGPGVHRVDGGHIRSSYGHLCDPTSPMLFGGIFSRCPSLVSSGSCGAGVLGLHWILCALVLEGSGLQAVGLRPL